MTIEIVSSNSNPLVMSSREIAKLAKKRHFHVLRDIRVMLADIYSGNEQDYSYQHYMLHNPNLGHATYSMQEYGTSPTGKVQYEILLDKELSFTLVTGYDAKARHRIIQRWLFLENQKRKTPEELRLESIFNLLYQPVNLMSFEQISLSERLAQRRFTWQEFQEFFGMKNNTWFLRVIIGNINRAILGMSAGNFRRQILGPNQFRIVNGVWTRQDVDTNNLPQHLTKDFLPKPHQECIQQIMRDLMEYFIVRPGWTKTQVNLKCAEFIHTRKSNMEILIGRDLHELLQECIIQTAEYSRIHEVSPYDVINQNLIQLNYDQLALEREIRQRQLRSL